MTAESLPARELLANKPLIEAIFELRWRLEKTGDPSGGRDPGFKILLGRFFDNARSAYPTLVDLPATQVPEEMLPHVVRHQLRTAENAWPLLQLGPGILTANETAGYSWESFKPRLSEAIGVLFASYPKDIFDFAPTHVVLRYLNAMRFDFEKDATLTFLRNNLHTNVTLDPQLANTVQDLSQPRGLNLSLTFPMKEVVGVCGLSFSTGRSADAPALIWQLDAQARGTDVPLSEAALDDWLENAHTVIERWFLTLSRGALLNSFRG
jgi:uncharacterized protein (TIGR04255 family)